LEEGVQEFRSYRSTGVTGVAGVQELQEFTGSLSDSTTPAFLT
jgi:hypothetical protein